MAENKFWKLLRKGETTDLKLFKGRFDFYLNKRTGKEERMVVMHSRDAANVLALTKEGKIVMVKQFRFGIEEDTIEVPGGLVEKGEDPMVAAQRELLEETGYSGGKWSSLGYIHSNPVYMRGMIHQYLAVGVEKTDAQTLDAGENIEVLEITPEELKVFYKNESLRHPHTMTCISKVFDLYEKVKV